MQNTSSFLKIAAATGIILIASLAQNTTQAAILNGSTGTAFDPVNFTTLTDTPGEGDWAIWENSYTGTTAAPSDQKLGVTDLISDITASGTTTSVSGSTFGWGPTVSWSDGTSATNRVSTSIGGGVLARPLSTVGASLSVDLTGAAGQVYTAYFWVLNAASDAEFTASLSGATSYIATQNASGTNNVPELYIIEFSPDSVSDKLNVTFEMTVNGTATTASNVRIGAIAVALPAVPEPSSIALLVIAFLGLGVCWYRQRR